MRPQFPASAWAVDSLMVVLTTQAHLSLIKHNLQPQKTADNNIVNYLKMIHTRILYSIFSVFIFSYVLSILKVQALVPFDANQEVNNEVMTRCVDFIMFRCNSTYMMKAKELVWKKM